MSEVAVVTDSTVLPRARRRGGERRHRGPALRRLRRRPHGPRDGDHRLRRVLRGAARRRSAADHLAAVGGRLPAAYEPLLAEGREVVSVHISGGLSGTPEAARQAKEALEREGKGGERIEVIDSTTAAGGLGFMVLAAAKAARDGHGRREQVAAHVAAARSRAEDVVRGRHARVPAPRRAHRRRQRVDRLHAEGQADPHRGERDDPGRARAHERARVRADGRLRPAAPRLGRRRLVRPAHQRARPGRARWWSAAARCSGTSRRSSARSARCSPSHTGPGLLGIGGLPQHFVR